MGNGIQNLEMLTRNHNNTQDSNFNIGDSFEYSKSNIVFKLPPELIKKKL